MDAYYERQIRVQLEGPRRLLAGLDHPCFNNEAHGKKGRLHLPVSRSCNIQCRFCTRSCSRGEERPGASGGILAAEEAVEVVGKALELCPEISVVGIAGPGDALASDNAISALTLVHKAYPELIMCLSTNGLALPGKAQMLYDCGVRTITVTVNAVSPQIASRVISHIVWQGEVIRAGRAGEILVSQQLEGIREACCLGMLVKVNTVLIPTVNDGHIEEIAEAVQAAGADIHNIIPLIPQHELAHIPPPDCIQLNQARAAAGKHLPQFRHCRHCRADACGLIGKDLSNELYGQRQMETFSHG